MKEDALDSCLDEMAGELMMLVNVGCGTRTRDGWVNIDRSAYFLLRKSSVLRFFARLFLTEERLSRLSQLSGNLIWHDLKNGIPITDDCVSMVYASHVLEHIDREYVDHFLAEIYRVLRPGGIIRIVVPDFKRLVDKYVATFEAALKKELVIAVHERSIEELLEQSVRKIPASLRTAGRWRRKLEMAVLGDARARGETHQWMYDRLTLANLLEKNGFVDIVERNYKTSYMVEWRSFMLDEESDGSEYKPGSLYMEARKPGVRREGGRADLPI